MTESFDDHVLDDFDIEAAKLSGELSLPDLGALMEVSLEPETKPNNTTDAATNKPSERLSGIRYATEDGLKSRPADSGRKKLLGESEFVYIPSSSNGNEPETYALASDDSPVGTSGAAGDGDSDFNEYGVTAEIDVDQWMSDAEIETRKVIIDSTKTGVLQNGRRSGESGVIPADALLSGDVGSQPNLPLPEATLPSRPVDTIASVGDVERLTVARPETHPVQRKVRVPKREQSPARVATRHGLIRLTSYGLLGADKIIGDRVREGFGVLMYHRICPHPRGYKRPTLNVTPEKFEQQIVGLLERGFEFRHLAGVVDDMKHNREVPRNTVVLTFDDGFAGVYRHAYPVLKQFKIPATVFVCTGLINRPTAMPFDPWGKMVDGRVPDTCYRPLTSRECFEMHESGLVDIGAHTHTHADFRGRPGELYDDLQKCVEYLQEHFNVERPTFAFPFGTPSLGYADRDLTKAVQLVGLRCAMTSEARVNSFEDDPYQLGRFNAFEWDTPATLQARLHGWYSWLPRLRASVRRRVRRKDSQSVQESDHDAG